MAIVSFEHSVSLDGQVREHKGRQETWEKEGLTSASSIKRQLLALQQVPGQQALTSLQTTLCPLLLVASQVKVISHLSLVTITYQRAYHL